MNARFVLLAVLIVLCVPTVNSYTLEEGCNDTFPELVCVVESFEEQTFPTSTNGSPYYVLTQDGTGSVVSIPDGTAPDGNNTMRIINNGAPTTRLDARFTRSASNDLCDGRIIDFYTKIVSQSSVVRVGIINSATGFGAQWNIVASGPSSLFGYDNAAPGTPSLVPVVAMTNSLTGATGIWEHFGLSCDAVQGCLLNYQLSTSSCTSPTTASAVSANRFEIGFNSQTNGAHVDRVNLGPLDIPLPALDSDQFAVTNLVGGSMEPTGRTIITRENGGTLIATYATASVGLGTVGTASTPNCGARQDGVLAETFDRRVFTVYVDCDVSGDSNAFRIRDNALNAAPFVPPRASGCEFQVQDNEQDFDTDIPNELKEVGSILSLPFDFSNCSNVGVNYGGAAWVYSEFDTGNLGVYGVLYKTGNDQEDTANAQLDTSATPQINHFCSWHNFSDGFDYIGGVADQGPLGVYHASAALTNNNGIIDTVVVGLDQVFLNNGQFSDGQGIACTTDKVIVLKTNVLYVISGILNGTPTVDYSKSLTSTLQRGVTVTGSGKFMAYVNGANIEFAWVSNGTVTDTEPLPTGTFVGMDFDSGGEVLAVYTSDFVTVIQTGPATCEIANSCASDGGVGTDEPPGSGGGGSATTTSTARGGGFLGGPLGALGATLAALATVLMFITVAFLVTRPKKGDDK